MGMNYIERIDKCIQLNIELGCAVESDLVGLSLEEIDRIERAAGTRFPDAYKYFLNRIGKAKTTWLENCFVYYPFFMVNREKYYRLVLATIENNEQMPLHQYAVKKSDFIFLSELAHKFYYFEASSNLRRDAPNPDPPVYCCNDLVEYTREADSFSEWLYGHISGE
jgi:SMI1 / KNR4 family (SUKH-1)